MIKTITDTLRENFKYEWEEGTFTEVLPFFAPIEKSKKDNKTNNMNLNNTYKTHKLVITLFGKKLEFKPKIDKKCVIKRIITIPETQTELTIGRIENVNKKAVYYEINTGKEDNIKYKITFSNFTPNSTYTVTRVWNGKKADDEYDKLEKKKKYTFKNHSRSRTYPRDREVTAFDKNNLKIDYTPDIQVTKNSTPASVLNRVVFKGQLRSTVPINLG
jgi:hypothetical protein